MYIRVWSVFGLVGLIQEGTAQQERGNGPAERTEYSKIKLTQSSLSYGVVGHAVDVD